MLNVNWILFKLLKLESFKCRSLTEGEIKICKTVFGDLINYQPVKIMNHPYLPWQPAGILMAPKGYLHLKNADYCDDFSQQNLAYQAIFIHEMAHIYQFQRNINVFFYGAILQIAFYSTLGRYNPYKYTLKAHKTYFDYNIEQQGDIAKDIFLHKIENIILPTTPS
ncbi:hypothetical protein [Acinetobacter silvestris]|uniref:Type IV secretion protein Rhs n=1 Tax=Acinetobacter silvestris TaxID=1977882 RepID=A0A1Y3CJN5_9GAMM|nr:hypothetical protein [Acinetobacter silvestris]OTG66808.1 hypothetical protein B9T28_05610 [Acinetobacter silvestris]